MKLLKYPHSCMLIETAGMRFLFDPGNIGFKDVYINEWSHANAIFITHRHGDHCYADKLTGLPVPVYATAEVHSSFPQLPMEIVKAGDILRFGSVSIEVVNGVHGFLPSMQNNPIRECVGYILDDGHYRVYISGDTMPFENDYHADIACIGASGQVCMTGYEAALAAKAIGASLLIPVHLESPNHRVNLEELANVLDHSEIDYRILKTGDALKL